MVSQSAAPLCRTRHSLHESNDSQEHMRTFPVNCRQAARVGSRARGELRPASSVSGSETRSPRGRRAPDHATQLLTNFGVARAAYPRNSKTQRQLRLVGGAAGCRLAREAELSWTSEGETAER
jgi:hypothetical protein